MLSPKRVRRSERAACQPAAARTQVPTRRVTSGSPTCPTTVLRSTRMRVCTCPNSRSPWAAWFRFMKSMSISAHGSCASACVCRCSSGTRSASRPGIHILAGENVCIQATTPMQASAAVASRHTRRMASGVVTTGFQTTRTGTSGDASSASATRRDWSATWRSVSSPYSAWLPVRNQTSRPSKVLPAVLTWLLAVRRRSGSGRAGGRRRPARSAAADPAASRRAPTGRRPRT